MKPQSRTLSLCLTVLFALLANVAFAIDVVSADYTWTGLGDTSVWNDPANWTGGPVGGFPGAAWEGDGTVGGNTVNGADGAIFPNGVGNVVITSGFADYADRFNLLETGDGTVTLPSTWNPRRAGVGGSGTGRRSPILDVDSGGLHFATGGILPNEFNSPMSSVSINGHLTATQLFTSQITVTGGQIALQQLRFRSGAYTFTDDWHLVNGADLRIHHYFSATSFTFTGTPTIEGGRPNWDFTGSVSNQFVPVTLNPGTTLYGNVVQFDGFRNDTGGDILLASAATVDVNTLHIASGGNATRDSYLNLSDDTMVYIRGSGTAWNNNSINNTNFNIIDSTVVFDPAGGTLSVSTGSEDRGGANAADWDDNFAFGNLRITENSTVTVTGTDNFGDTNPSALYVRGTLYGEHNSTIDGGRNIYVYGGLEPGSSPGTLNIVGNLFLGENAVSTFELNDPNVVGGGINDLVNVDGDLTLDGLLEVNVADPMLLANYTLFTYTGTLTDNGMILNTMLAKPAIVDMSVPGIVTLNVIPEPTSGILLALAGLALLKRRRRRQ